MTQFKGFDGMSEAQLKQWFAFMLAQDSAGNATTGVLTGLAVTQTTTASANVDVAAGFGVVQDATLDGATPAVNDTSYALDVLTSNPMGGLPRNDIVVWDIATVSGGTGGIRVVVGTPNASPTDPTVPATAIPLARLRHAASATTVPSSVIDDLRAKVSLFGAKPEGKRTHWASVTTGATDASGYKTITHGAGFTPTVVVGTNAAGYQMGIDNITSTTFRIRFLQADGTVFSGASSTLNYFCGE